jgi:DNA-damage-inducible protein J
MNGKQLLLTSAILCIILYLIYNTIRGKYMATVSIRMDDETKAAFEGFCNSVGLSVSAAVNMFAKVTVRENRIPFEITGDPFWSEENQARLRESMAQAKAGKLTKHEISEVL